MSVTASSPEQLRTGVWNRLEEFIRSNYENPDIEASLDLNQLEEVEYDDETATGHHVTGKALRLRSHGHCFEFLLDDATAREWAKLLPPHQFSEGTAQAV